jgi:hypothetical protein
MKTQTPWKTQPTRGKQSAIDRKWEIVIPLEGGETVVVGEHTGVDCLKKADAEHICRCVNMHDELVKALRRAVETLDALNGALESRYIDEHLLLLKAEGGQP